MISWYNVTLTVEGRIYKFVLLAKSEREAQEDAYKEYWRHVKHNLVVEAAEE